MTRRMIYLLVEPSHITSAWCAKSIAGIKDGCAKHHIEMKILDSIEDIEKYNDIKTIIIVCATLFWTRYTVKYIHNFGIKTIIVGAFPNDISENVSGPLLNRQQLVERVVQYLYDCGKRRIASVGNEKQDINDVKRENYFLRMVKELGLDIGKEDVYHMEDDVGQCVSRMLDKIDKYDAVMCVNDYVGVELLHEAGRRGIKVPEQLFVVGSGNLTISRCITPTLTTTTLNYYEQGKQAVNIWIVLDENEMLTTVNFHINCEIISRESTGFVSIQNSDSIQPLGAGGLLITQTKPMIGKLHCLEKCLLECDELDYRIIAGILEKKSFEQIASELFVAQGTVQYRLNKIYNTVNVDNRKEFEKLIEPYFTDLNFFKNHIMS